MKRTLLFILLLVIALILQVTVFGLNSIAGIKPDLLLIMVVIAAMLYGGKFGLGIGFAAGTLQDLFLGGMLGVFTIVKIAIGGLSGFIEGQVYKENYIVPPLVIFSATIAHETLLILLSEELIFNLNFFRALYSVILPEALYNAVLGLIIYFLVYHLGYSGGKGYGN